MCHFQKWEEQLDLLYKTYGSICIAEDVEYKKDAIATQEEVIRLEEALGMPIPQSLRDTFLRLSKHICFSAFLPSDFVLPEALTEIFSAYFTLSMDEMIEAEASRKSWVDECFSNEEDEYDKVWHNKLGFMTVGNGDVIAFDLNDTKEDKRVVYLSHDDGEGHGVILGETFADYFNNLLLIGGCGNEDWQMLPFIQASKGLDAYSANADTYRKLIGLVL